ncbi:TrmH family RNA methyltransferase [Candidatus Margulisiibacteriota bacterium]
MKDKLRLVQNLLEKRRARHKEQRFVVEGPHLVEEAGEWIDFVVYSQRFPIVSILEQKGIACIKVSREQFADVSEVETPQGILAVVKEQRFELKDVLKGPDPLIVFCVEVQDPGNLGTIIRTADAAGSAGIILSKGTVDLYNGKVIRGSQGSLFHLPIMQIDDVKATIEQLRKKKVKMISTDAEAKKECYAADLRGAVAVLVGNEGAGLFEDVVKLSDEVVSIPMPGQAESLNVGISTAVMLYEAIRQRRS